MVAVAMANGTIDANDAGMYQGGPVDEQGVFTREHTPAVPHVDANCECMRTHLSEPRACAEARRIPTHRLLCRGVRDYV